jgi:hypothetical protein
MPYKDADRRKAAARKWRLLHRADRAAYMRRYRRSRSSGRSRGRPRVQARMFETREIATDRSLVVRPGEPTADSEPVTLAPTDCPNPSVHESSPKTDHQGGDATDGRSEQLPPGTEAGLPLPSDPFVA